MADKEFAPSLSNIISPAGTAVQVYLTKPSDKFNKAGVYSVKLAIDRAAAEPMCKKLDALLDQVWAYYAERKPVASMKRMTKRAPYEDELDEKTGEPTGRVVLNVKEVASRVDAKGRPTTFAPKLYDVKGNEVKRVPNVGRGTTMKVGFNARGYLAEAQKEIGVTLRLRAAQILRLVEYAGSDFQFSEEDGDFEDTSSSTENESGFVAEGDEDSDF